MRELAFTVGWQSIVLVIAIAFGLLAGQLLFRQNVGGTSMSNSQMQAYLVQMPHRQEVLKRQIASLEASFARLEGTLGQMQSRIHEADDIVYSQVLEEREQKIEALETYNESRVQARILEIEAELKERLQHLEELYEEAYALRSEIGGIQL